MRRWTKGIVFVALFIPLLILLSAAQQPQQQFKIGIVNPLEVLDKSIEGKSVIARLQEKDKGNQTKLAAMDEDIRQLQTKITTQRLTATQDALMTMGTDLDKKQTDRKRFQEDSYREFTDLQNRLFNKITTELQPIVEQIGKEMGLEVIFDLSKSGIVYFNPAVDITAEIIKRYDASKATPKK